MKISEILDIVSKNENSAFFFTPKIYDDHKSYLFTNIKQKLTFHKNENLNEYFHEVEKQRQTGIGFGIINYELGYLFEDSLRELVDSENSKLMEFVFFDYKNVHEFENDAIIMDTDYFKNHNYSIDEFQLNVAEDEYKKAIGEVRSEIKKGNTYQVNFTLKGKFEFKGSFEKLFLDLIYKQSAKYCAFINMDDKIYISVSPELFFEMKNETIIVKPMKGTIKRGKNNLEDEVKKRELNISKKDQAENVMIVDLLRNDLGRISEFDSVKVDKLFEVEKYETLFQMVSKIRSKSKTKDIGEIIKYLFPCGSITGAPKISTMKIINRLEKEKRGIYTGAIGIIDKNNALFNVPIRTLEINKSSNRGDIGLGSGIVWDSQSENEYDEVKLKSEFFLKKSNEFKIFETMLIENGKIFLEDYHLERIEKACSYFLFYFDKTKWLNTIRNKINEHCSENHFRFLLKVSVNKWGEIETLTKNVESSFKSQKIVLSDKETDTNDQFLYFKTTNRNLYDEEYKKYSQIGYADVIYTNKKGEITEGAISNIFIEKEGKMYTPPIKSGLLNGCYRRFLLENQNNTFEKVLFKKDLIDAEKIFIVNSVRKMKRVYL